MALEQFLNTVQSLSNKQNYTELAEYLSKTGESLLSRNSGNLDNLIESLDLKNNTLVIISILTVKLRTSNLSGNDWNEFLNKCFTFLGSSDCDVLQIRKCPESYANLCKLISDELLNRDTPLRAVPFLGTAINKIRDPESSKNVLTSLHSDLIKICLKSKCFSRAIPLLSKDYFEFSKDCSTDPKNVLLFYYYGGLILGALKDYENALYYFEVVLTVPCNVISRITLEGYKKYLLVSLLVQDPNIEQQRLPKYASPVINKFIRNLCTPYHELIQAFYNTKIDIFEETITKHSEVFTADTNMGLVQQVSEARIKMNIKRLTKTFLTLSLNDVASRVFLTSASEAEKKLVQMIQEGSIQAKISQKDGMVRFNSNPEHFDSVDMLETLEENVRKCIELDARIASMDDDIVRDPNFIQKSVATAKELGDGDGDLGTSESNTVSSPPSGSKTPGASM